ncbi:hypothetical protein L7F22_013276 [Adiantum nelumboides]|nr:hypothetical protein [Adiantum nelumboides]
MICVRARLGSHLRFILKQMDSQKRQILLSWICSNDMCQSTRQLGNTIYHWLSMLTIILCILQQASEPFEIVEGGKKVPPILQTKDKIFEADKYVQNTDEAYRKIKLALEKTQSKQKKVVDHHRHELVFSLGDWVLLRFEKARLRKMKGKEHLFPKMGMQYYGPFQVCNKISDVACRLKLPEGWKIHNAFHVSLLRPFVGDVPEDIVPEEHSEVEELDEILVPKQILVRKDRKVRGKVARRYLVKFKNYSPMDVKWMEEAELVDSPQLLQLYLEAFQLQPTVT